MILYTPPMNVPIISLLSSITLLFILLITNCSYIPMRMKERVGKAMSKLKMKSKRKAKETTTKKDQSKKTITIDAEVATDKETIRFKHNGKVMEARLSDIKEYIHQVNDDDRNKKVQITNKSEISNISEIENNPTKQKSLKVAAKPTRMPVKRQELEHHKKETKIKPKDLPSYSDEKHDDAPTKTDRSIKKPEDHKKNVKNDGKQSPPAFKKEEPKTKKKHTSPVPESRKPKDDEKIDKTSPSNKTQKHVDVAEVVPPKKEEGGDITKMFQNLYKDPRIQDILTQPKSNSEDELEQMMHAPAERGRRHTGRNH